MKNKLLTKIDVLKLVDGDLNIINKIKNENYTIKPSTFKKLIFIIIQNSTDENRSEIIKLLINEISPLTIDQLSKTTNADVETFLMAAIKKSDPQMVRTLLMCGINPNVNTSFGRHFALAEAVLYASDAKNGFENNIKIIK